MNHANSIRTDSNHANSTKIEPTNQHNLGDYHLLHKIMSWNSHDPQANTNYVTPQSSKISMRTLPHNFARGTIVLWNTHNPKYTTAQASTFSTKTVPYNFTYGTQFPSYPPPQSNDPSLPPSVTPTGNYTPCNNPPKPVIHVPNDPDSDPSSLDSSFSGSSDWSDSRYFNWIQHKGKKRWSKSRNNGPIKKCANLTSKLLKYTYNSKVAWFKLDKNPLQRRVYFLNFVNYFITSKECDLL